jgi:hypothetical protein
MSCLDTRRELLTTPGQLSREAREHLNECESCRRHAREQAQFNRKLEQAMRIPVPDHLGQEVIFERSTRSRIRQRWIAVAAGVCLMIVAVAAIVLRMDTYDEGLVTDMIAHMTHDPIHESERWPQARNKLALANQGVGFTLTHTPGEPVAARICDVGTHTSSHFVVETGGVRATAFVMPGDFEPGDRYVNVDGQRGRLVSTPQGMIAVFCPERRVLDAVAQSLRDSVDWGSA